MKKLLGSTTLAKIINILKTLWAFYDFARSSWIIQFYKALHILISINAASSKKKLCNALQIWNNKGYKSLLFPHNQVLCQFGYLMFLLLQTFLSDISKKNAKKKEFPLIQLICAQIICSTGEKQGEFKAGPELWKASITEQQLHLPNSISISLENRPSLIGIDCTWPCNFLENIGTIWHLPSIIPEQQALLSKNLSMLQMLTSSDFKRKYWSQLKKITFFIQPSVACRISSFLQS